MRPSARLSDEVRQPGGSADWYGALTHHHVALAEVREQAGERGIHVGEVGGVGAVFLRCAHANEVHLRSGGVGDVGAESQPAGRCG
jgi:hypothetical protein